MSVKIEKLVSKKAMSLMVAVVLLIAGVLFCISPAIGEQAAGIVIGIGVLLLGVIFGVKDFLLQKSLISRGVLVASAIAALGVYFMADGSIVSKIIGVIPYVLIVTGACVVADAILIKVRDKADNKKFAIELSVGLVAVVLGSLILSLSFFRQALAVIIGILLIAGSVYYLVDTVQKNKTSKSGRAAENVGSKPAQAEAAPAEDKTSADKASKPTSVKAPAKSAKTQKTEGATKPAKTQKTE